MPIYLYLVNFNQKESMFFDLYNKIYRYVIGMRKKILFKVKYTSVYLMLNAVSVNTIDYKSIALPAELQGHIFDKSVI